MSDRLFLIIVSVIAGILISLVFSHGARSEVLTEASSEVLTEARSETPATSALGGPCHNVQEALMIMADGDTDLVARIGEGHNGPITDREFIREYYTSVVPHAPSVEHAARIHLFLYKVSQHPDALYAIVLTTDKSGCVIGYAANIPAGNPGIVVLAKYLTDKKAGREASATTLPPNHNIMSAFNVPASITEASAGSTVRQQINLQAFNDGQYTDQSAMGGPCVTVRDHLIRAYGEYAGLLASGFVGVVEDGEWVSAYLRKHVSGVPERFYDANSRIYVFGVMTSEGPVFQVTGTDENGCTLFSGTAPAGDPRLVELADKIGAQQ